jgi:hypothetical protein
LDRHLGLPPASVMLWLAPAALLLVALLPLPYGFYTLLRLVVSGCAAALAVIAFRRVDSTALLYGAIAILFNPIIPVHLDRSTWTVLDVMAAAWFLKHLHWMVYPISFQDLGSNHGPPLPEPPPKEPSPPQAPPPPSNLYPADLENGRATAQDKQSDAAPSSTGMRPHRTFRQIMAANMRADVADR